MLYAVILATLAGLVAADFDPELHAKYLTMPESSFIEYFNAQGYSWKMAEYDNIREKYAPCAHFDKESFEKLPLPTYDLERREPPVNFDVRYAFAMCSSTKQVYDQGNCGSCWTFGTATTASDRACIHDRSYTNIDLSEQDFECMQKQVCSGGNPLEAFVFWLERGLVSQKCKPYNVTELLENKCVSECVNSVDYIGDKHFAQGIYRLRNNSHDIKVDLWQMGSIQAGFVVYEDFFKYKSGIYEHTHGSVVGRHSVRIIGYGVENGTDYWLVANSWGRRWGENGWFRIKAFQEGIDFENYLITGF